MSRQSVLDDIETVHQYAMQDLVTASTQLMDALDYLGESNIPMALEKTIFALGNCMSAVTNVIYHDGAYTNAGILHFFLDAHTIAEAEAEDFTMLILLQAFIDAEDDHRSAWQLLTDAYHASMYDKPFDLNYHTTWVERFRSWR